jgi:hypothetical protein
MLIPEKQQELRSKFLINGKTCLILILCSGRKGLTFATIEGALVKLLYRMVERLSQDDNHQFLTAIKAVENLTDHKQFDQKMLGKLALCVLLFCVAADAGVYKMKLEQHETSKLIRGGK